MTPSTPRPDNSAALYPPLSKPSLSTPTPVVHRLARRVLPVLLLLSPLYMLLLLLSLHVPPTAVCSLLTNFDASHTCLPPVELSHTADCRLHRAVIPAVLDRFVLAHLLGWAVKAFLYPHRPTLWAASLLFELAERVALPFVPSLRECWWDSLLLDVLICNALGIELVLAFVKSIVHLSTATHALVVLCLIVTDLNAFLLKQAFHVRNAAPVNVYRLMAFAVLAVIALPQLRRAQHTIPMLPAVYITVLAVEFAVAIAHLR